MCIARLMESTPAFRWQRSLHHGSTVIFLQRTGCPSYLGWGCHKWSPDDVSRGYCEPQPFLDLGVYRRPLLDLGVRYQTPIPTDNVLNDSLGSAQAGLWRGKQESTEV